MGGRDQAWQECDWQGAFDYDQLPRHSWTQNTYGSGEGDEDEFEADVFRLLDFEAHAKRQQDREESEVEGRRTADQERERATFARLLNTPTNALSSLPKRLVAQACVVGVAVCTSASLARRADPRKQER